ncbi:hypothetical protein PC129_g4827 [Phytophthora cactorum]|uniref:Cyclin N-terminal domain-containing protein n=1 Tax=Phytophthora cactorum TaxID=29920 RepID=A0A8T1LAP9_9STRA|nr:hypothetical protein PC112_g7411 [Phytophthora cactorum]KAG2831203.1 hypothetical protein PC111_g7091 [Phytophthora cactorum]KAG2912200.1 hypothetical protein PC114_g9008 [Phytophthora cactorum]KAG2937869.1 hypothetical protein PC115_g3970 [Phytophthora cactorum]KAG3224511.1 hypothetical protein PC129_g4827 [Phytophthora cactorum]
MGGTGRGRSASSGGEERAVAVSTPSQRTPIDEVASGASNAPPAALNSAPQASESASNVENTSTADSSAPQRPPRPEQSRKPLNTPPSSSSDRKRRKNGANRGPSGGDTPLQTPPEVPAIPTAPLEPECPLLSDSQWENEIAGFGTVLNDVLHCVTNRELVTKTAEYMATFPQHALRFQIKMKQRAYAEGARGFQAKLMLFYVLHEFLKSFEGERLQQVQREWFQTIDEVLNACAREIRYGDKRNAEENRKRVFKTLARWEELKLYPRKIKAWKSLVMGECKPRRAPVPLPRSETERQAEAPDQLQSFELPPPSTPQLQLDRSNCPLVFERRNFDSKPEEKQHWRYTAIAFIDILSQCLGLSSDIALTACIFFHRVFDRGIYTRERYKFAAACLFLSAKASSKRMKLLRMVRVMYDILETPLFAGDEELLEIERLQLLYYEMEVLQGIDFELTTEMPFYYLRRVLEKMPEKFRDSINDDAQTALEELFFLPVCVDISPQLLGEAAAYIATWNKGKDFKFKWCSPSQEGNPFNERTARDALRSYRALQRWKKSQQAEFDALVKSASSLEGDEAAKLKLAFKPQLGGLRLDPSAILNEAEFTKKTEEDSKEWAKSGTKNGSDSRSRRGNNYRDDNEPRIKLEKTQAGGRGYDRERDRYRPRSRSRSRSGSDSRYGRRSGSAVKYERDESRPRSRDRRDRYDYEDYDDSDRYRERRRGDDKYGSSRDRSSNYDKEERSYDRHGARDLDYYRDPSYFDRRERKSDRNGHRERDSRSNSRSRSRSRSPRESSRSSRKRKRNYSSRGRSDSRSRSSSRSHSRDRSHYYRAEDPSPSSSRSGRANKKNNAVGVSGFTHHLHEGVAVSKPTENYPESLVIAADFAEKRPICTSSYLK